MATRQWHAPQSRKFKCCGKLYEWPGPGTNVRCIECDRVHYRAVMPAQYIEDYELRRAYRDKLEFSLLFPRDLLPLARGIIEQGFDDLNERLEALETAFTQGQRHGSDRLHSSDRGAA